MALIRTVRNFFKQAVPAKDRFRTNDKPSQINFFKWFDSIAFIAEKDDTATTAQQGLSKAALDTEAASFQLNNNADGMTRGVLPYQLPEVIAGDVSIVVTPVLYRQSLATFGANVQGQTRRVFKITAAPAALNEPWVTIDGTGTFANGQAVPALHADIDNGGTLIQVRKTATNKIAIRGFATCTPAWTIGNTMFTLPTGYRPLAEQFVVAIDTVSYVGIQSTGVINPIGTGYIGVTTILIPETEISVD